MKPRLSARIFESGSRAFAMPAVPASVLSRSARARGKRDAHHDEVSQKLAEGIGRQSSAAFGRRTPQHQPQPHGTRDGDGPSSPADTGSKFSAAQAASSGPRRRRVRTFGYGYCDSCCARHSSFGWCVRSSHVSCLRIAIPLTRACALHVGEFGVLYFLNGPGAEQFGPLSTALLLGWAGRIVAGTGRGSPCHYGYSSRTVVSPVRCVVRWCARAVLRARRRWPRPAGPAGVGGTGRWLQCLGCAAMSGRRSPCRHVR